MVVWFFSLVFGVGLLLFVLGRRGRRVGSQPVCRRCDFDLRGKPADVNRCSECGADLASDRAVVTGRREPIRNLWRVGLALTLVGFVCGGAVLYLSAARVNVYQYLPLSVLEMQIASTTPNAAARAEIIDRIKSRRLTNLQIAALIDRVLEIQADSAKPWNYGYGEIILEGGTAVGLTAAQTEKLFVNSFEEKFVIQPRIRQLAGRYYCVEGTNTARAVPGLEWSFAGRRTPLMRNGTLVGPLPAMPHFTTQWLLALDVDGWALGPHELTYDVEVEAQVTAPFATPMIRWGKSMRVPVEVVPANVVVDKLVDARLPEVRRLYPHVTLMREDDELLLVLRAVRSPHMIASRVVLRQGERVITLGDARKTPVADRDVYFVHRWPIPKDLQDGPATLVIDHHQDVSDNWALYGPNVGMDVIDHLELPVTVGPYDPSVYYEVDESKRAAMKPSLDVFSCVNRQLQYQYSLHASTAVRLDHRLVIKKGNVRLPYNHTDYTFGMGGSERGGTVTIFSEELKPGDTVDLILQPSFPDHHYCVDATQPKAWGGEIVFPGNVVR